MHPQPSDLFTFSLPNSRFGAIVCSQLIGKRTVKIRLVPVAAIWDYAPKVKDIREAKLPAVHIATTMSREQIMERQPGVEMLWNPSDPSSFFFVGLVELVIEPTDWARLSQHLEPVGQLTLKPAFNTMGSLQYLDSFEGLKNIYADLDHYAQAFEWKTYPVKLLCV